MNRHNCNALEIRGERGIFDTISIQPVFIYTYLFIIKWNTKKYVGGDGLKAHRSE